MPDAATGSVPAQSNSSTVNPAEVLSSILSSNQQNLQKYALAAATPVPGGSQGQFPMSMDPTPKQAPQAPLNHSEVVGKGNARAQGIGNAIVGAMNAISGVSTAVDNKKRLEVATATQQLLTAQSALNQAKQILQTDPDNKAAKDAIDHNTQIMNGILSNDKIRKAIAKGFNIDFTDPSANNTPDHQAVAQGKDMAEKSLSLADQFNEKTPTQFVPNARAQAQYAAAQQQSKSTVDTMKALVPLLSAQMRAETADRQIQGRMDVAQFKAAAQEAQAYTKSQDDWQKLQARFQHDDALNKTKFGQDMQKIFARGSVELQTFREKVTMKATDPATLQKDYDAFNAKSTATIATMTSAIAALEKTKQDMAVVDTDDKRGQIQSLDQQLQIAQQQLKTYKAAVDGSNQYYQDRLKRGGTSNGSGSSSVSGAGSGDSSHEGFANSSNYLNPSDSLPEDDEDPDDQ